jgi:hypothetical protein
MSTVNSSRGIVASPHRIKRKTRESGSCVRLRFRRLIHETQQHIDMKGIAGVAPAGQVVSSQNPARFDQQLGLFGCGGKRVRQSFLTTILLLPSAVELLADVACAAHRQSSSDLPLVDRGFPPEGIRQLHLHGMTSRERRQFRFEESLPAQPFLQDPLSRCMRVVARVFTRPIVPVPRVWDRSHQARPAAFL